MGLLILQMLKWILWIVLFLLLFFLAILFLMLFVPVRYRAEGEYREGNLCIKGRISWFLSLISLFPDYNDYNEGLHIRLKILGITFYDSDKPQKKREKKQKKERPLKKSSKPKTQKPEDFGVINTAKPHPPALPTKGAAVPVKADSPEENHYLGKPSLADRIKVIWEKIKGIGKKLESLIKKVKSIWQGFQDKKALLDHYLGLWKREETQITWSRAKHKFGKVIRSVGPRKLLLKGNIGFDDPALTGQMMAGLGIACPWIGNYIQINPDFEQSILELKGYIKGRIRFGVLLYQFITLLLNRHCIAFIKMIFNEIMDDKNKEENNSNMQEVADDRQ